MIIILSPSKTLRDEDIKHPNPTLPIFPSNTIKLMRKLNRTSKSDLKKMLRTSDVLTELNYTRIKNFEYQPDRQTGTAAIYAFKGEVFQGLDSVSWSDDDMMYSENRLIILSGLYGVLKPSTLVQPYRLDMEVRLKVDRKKNLYDFWGELLTSQINKYLKNQDDRHLINLASREYSSVLNIDKIEGEIIEINFREWRKDTWTFISFNAKKARGMMARYIIQNQIKDITPLKKFDLDGYTFNEPLSSERELFFTK